MCTIMLIYIKQNYISKEIIYPKKLYILKYVKLLKFNTFYRFLYFKYFDIYIKQLNFL